MSRTPAPETEHQLENARQHAIDVLSDAFASDQLNVDEYEQRVDLVHRLETRDEIKSLLASLEDAEASEAETSLAASPTQQSHALVAQDRTPETVMMMFGRIKHQGAGTLRDGQKFYIVSSRASIDLCDVAFESEVTTMAVFALFSRVTIDVPPQLRVVCESRGVFSNVWTNDLDSKRTRPTGPTLNIKVTAHCSKVRIRVRNKSASGAKSIVKHWLRRLTN